MVIDNPSEGRLFIEYENKYKCVTNMLKYEMGVGRITSCVITQPGKINSSLR
jgi:hypothetical protein